MLSASFVCSSAFVRILVAHFRVDCCLSFCFLFSLLLLFADRLLLLLVSYWQLLVVRVVVCCCYTSVVCCSAVCCKTLFVCCSSVVYIIRGHLYCLAIWLSFAFYLFLMFIVWSSAVMAFDACFVFLLLAVCFVLQVSYLQLELLLLWCFMFCCVLIVAK